VHPDEAAGLLARREAALDPAVKGPLRMEFRLRHPGGVFRWVSLHGHVRFEGEGRLERAVRTLGTTQDITERKEAEEALRTAQEQLRLHAQELERTVLERTAKLQELVGELEHFSYTITHDMRAPLRAISGFADLANEMCPENGMPELKAFLRRIMSSAQRMDLLITDSLSYSKTVRQELPLSPIDVGALIRGMLDSYPEFQPAKAHIEIQGEIPLVMGNEAALTQCFSNLLGNAVKFVPPGKSPEIQIRWEKQADRVRIFVQDNGIGISPRMLPRVFDMFSRGHNATEYQGTGIGLALVRKVVGRMDGRVGVESEPGNGSLFWVELKSGEAAPRPEPLNLQESAAPTGI
jgi:signal transduction histidine kinase